MGLCNPRSSKHLGLLSLTVMKYCNFSDCWSYLQHGFTTMMQHGINCWMLDNKVLVFVCILQLPVWSPTGDMAPGWMQSAALSADRRCGTHDLMKSLVSQFRLSLNMELKCLSVFQVSVLCNLFNESRSDHQSKEVLGEITDYNKRYSGAPRRVSTLLLNYP